MNSVISPTKGHMVSLLCDKKITSLVLMAETLYLEDIQALWKMGSHLMG